MPLLNLTETYFFEKNKQIKANIPKKNPTKNPRNNSNKVPCYGASKGWSSGPLLPPLYPKIPPENKLYYLFLLLGLFSLFYDW